jgi:hypothetical protein
MSRENFESQNGRASSKKLLLIFLNKGLSSIFSSVKNKIRDFFLPSKEDDKNLKASENEISPNGIYSGIYPGYINDNQHIYEAPTFMAETRDRKNKKSQLDQRINHRKISTESHKTNTTRKKVNSVIKIATLITNRQFNKGKTGSANYSNYAFDKNNTSIHPQSAFKVLDESYKNFSFQKRKIINCKDFQESVLKESNIARPIPIKASEEGFRALSQKRERPLDAMSTGTTGRIKNLKKQKIEDDDKTIFSQISSLHKFRIYQKEDASMHSINSINTVTQKRDDNFFSNVSMKSRQDTNFINNSSNKSILSKSSYPKTIEELKKEIEEKRKNNRKLYDEISQRSSRRLNNFKYDFEERRKILNNYYKEKQKSYQDINLLQDNKHNETNVFNLNESNLFDAKEDKKYTLSQSSITITSSSKERKKEDMVISKNEQFNIKSVGENGLHPFKGITNTTNINTPAAAKVELPNKMNTFGNSTPDNYSFLSSFGKKENANENLLTHNNLQLQSNSLTDKKEAQEEKKTFGSLFGANKLVNSNSENVVTAPEIKNDFTAEFNKTSKPTGSIGSLINNNQSIFNKLEESNKAKEEARVLLPPEDDKKQLFSGVFNKKEEALPFNNTSSSLFGSKTLAEAATKPLINYNKQEEKQTEEKVQESSKSLFSTPSLFGKKEESNTGDSKLINTPNPLNIPESTQSHLQAPKPTSLFGENLGIATKGKTEAFNTFSNTSKPLSIFGNSTNTQSSSSTELNKEDKNKTEHKPSEIKPVEDINTKINLLPSLNTKETKPELKTGLFSQNTDSTNKSFFGSNITETKIPQTESKPSSVSNLSFGKTTPSIGEIQSTENSSSLFNASNPFISASNKPNQVNNLFSPGKNIQSDQQSSKSVSLSQNQFFPKNNSNQSINKDIFGGSQQNNTFGLFGSNTSNTPAEFNINNSNEEMAISPITSPKTTSRTEAVELNKIPNIFGTSQLGINFSNVGASNNFPINTSNMFNNQTKSLFPKPQGQTQSNPSNLTPTFNSNNNSQGQGLFGSINSNIKPPGLLGSQSGLSFSLGKK